MKKFISIFMCLLMFGLNANAYYDINDYDLEEKVEVLSDFNIINGYSDGSFRPDNLITRAEFSKMIVDTILADTSSNSQNVFFDLEDSHWAKDYICIAKSLEIINGVSANYFEPESNITYEQATKMIVAALGYNEEAVKLGGYPSGYITKANELGILDNVYCNMTDYATRGDIATMVYNALNVKYYSIWNENGEVKRMESSKTLFQIHEDLKNINANINYDYDYSDDYSDEENAVG